MYDVRKHKITDKFVLFLVFRTGEKDRFNQPNLECYCITEPTPWNQNMNKKAHSLLQKKLEVIIVMFSVIDRS